MWAALNDIAAERGKTVHDVILEINRDRKGISLTAAIRVYIVEHYREALGRCRKEKAPPSPAGLFNDVSRLVLAIRQASGFRGLRCRARGRARPG